MKKGFRMVLEDFRGEKFTKDDIIDISVLVILFVVLLVLASILD